MTTTEAPSPELYQASSTELKTVNVLIIIDAETILETFDKGGFDNPTAIRSADTYISMIVRQRNHIQNQKGSELHAKLPLGENIRWRETTLSLNSEYSSLLYKYSPVGSDNEIIDNPRPLLVQGIEVPLPNPKDPKNPQKQKINDYFWQSTALKEGSQYYNFSFMILDRKGVQKGYYYWDPKITVTQEA